MKLRVTIEGYADRWGSKTYNQRLSEDRASHIAKEFGRLGVNSSRITTMGMSEMKPHDPNDNLDAWRANRRVEVKIVE